MVTAMFAAAQSGDVDEIRRLVAGGADVEEQGDRGRRPMHVAALYGHVNVIRTLAELGAKLDPRDDNGNTPHLLAHDFAQQPEDGDDVNPEARMHAVSQAMDSLGLVHPGDVLLEPVSYAADGTPQYLMPPELQLTHAFMTGGTTAQCAQEGGNFGDGRPFRRVRAITSAALNELMKASAEGNVAMIRRLVAGGVDPNGKDYAGWRPLHLAADRGQSSSVYVLAQLGAHLHATEPSGIVPVYFAAKGRHVKTIKVFQQLGVDIDALMTLRGNSMEVTPLALAVMEGELDAIRILARCGANVNATADGGEKTVHLAAMNDRVEAMRLLWELGADLKAKLLPSDPNMDHRSPTTHNSVNGFTPLQLSVEYENPAVQKVLEELQDVAPPQPGACVACGVDGGGDAAFKKCARCKDVTYCGKECQRSHWRLHKASCVAASGK
jgi:ankyrin repeat protein